MRMQDLANHAVSVPVDLTTFDEALEAECNAQTVTTIADPRLQRSAMPYPQQHMGAQAVFHVPGLPGGFQIPIQQLGHYGPAQIDRSSGNIPIQFMNPQFCSTMPMPLEGSMPEWARNGFAASR